MAPTSPNSRPVADLAVPLLGNAIDGSLEGRISSSAIAYGAGSRLNMQFYISTSWVLFTEGLSGIPSLAVSYFYKNTLKVNPALLTTVESLTYLPWSCTPLYGFISDSFPIMGYRRKPYIFLSGVAGCLTWVLMWCAVEGVWTGLICMMVGSIALAVADVMAQAMVAERSKGQSQEFAAHLQSTIWGAAAIGSLIASFVGGWLLNYITDRQVFLLSSCLPLSLVVVACISPDKRVTARGVDSAKRDGIKAKAIQLYHTVMIPEIFYPTAFVFLLNATPATGSTWFYFYTSDPPLGLGFSSQFMGTISLVGSFFKLAGVIFFQAFLKKTSFRPIFFWGAVVSAALGLSNLILIFRYNRRLSIPDEFFCLGESAVQSVVGWVVAMPIGVLAARLCPEGMEVWVD